MAWSGRKHGPSPGERFPSTDWEVVVAAKEGGDESTVSHALGQLCDWYWRPVYGFIRSRGHSVDDASDLTQEFFARFIEGRFLDLVDQKRGRFRTFLAMCIRRFLANEWDRASALKRGGGVGSLSMDWGIAEQQLADLQGKALGPDQLFDMQWAYSLLEGVLDRLRAEYASRGDLTRFTALEPFLISGRERDRYAAIATQLGSSEGAVKVGVHRLRNRYRALLREEVAKLVVDPADVEEELRVLREIISE